VTVPSRSRRRAFGGEGTRAAGAPNYDRRVTRVVVLVALAACGRIGFDPGAAGVSDANAPGDTFTAPTCAGGCAAGEVCATPVGDCLGAPSCVAAPATCPVEEVPVCGCDGLQYTNECEANRAMHGIALVGTCPLSTGLPTCTPACGATDYCWTPIGTCDAEPGTCQPYPEDGSCDVPVGVCACNGTTYLTLCDAARAGVPVRNLGNCTF
jgi:hypothetical protein